MALSLLFLCPVLAEPPGLVAIRNARVVTVSGPTLPRATVVLKDGLISQVGAEVTPPAGAFIIEGDGLTVYPGLIDALSTWGIEPPTPPAGAAGPGGGRAAPQPNAGPNARGPEDRPATTSWLKAADLVKPTDRRLEAARAAGFTSAVTFPRQGIIAGHGALVNLAGETSGKMILDPSSGLFLTLRTSGTFGSFPGSLMGVIAYIRQVWLDADHYRAARDMYAKSPAGIPRPDYDRALEGVLEARRILLPAVSTVEVDRMIRFAAELKTPAMLYGMHEGFRTAPLVKQANVPVILNVKWPTKPRDGDPALVDSWRTLEVRDLAPTSPAKLAEAGVKFAVSSDGIDAPRDILRALKKSIDRGLKPEQAIRALTLNAAEMYGAGNRLGSIEPGKIANLAVVKGDIFDERSPIQMVFIDGVKYLPPPEAPPAPPGSGNAARPTNPAEAHR